MEAAGCGRAPWAQARGDLALLTVVAEGAGLRGDCRQQAAALLVMVPQGALGVGEVDLEG